MSTPSSGTAVIMSRSAYTTNEHFIGHVWPSMFDSICPWFHKTSSILHITFHYFLYFIQIFRLIVLLIIGLIYLFRFFFPMDLGFSGGHFERLSCSILLLLGRNSGRYWIIVIMDLCRCLCFGWLSRWGTYLLNFLFTIKHHLDLARQRQVMYLYSNQQ